MVEGERLAWHDDLFDSGLTASYVDVVRQRHQRSSDDDRKQRPLEDIRR